MKDRYKFLIVLGVFVAAYFIPFGDERVRKAILEAFYMVQDYAQKHVLLCLVPAFFIAGAITVFVSEASVMKYLGPLANKFLSYSVASVSGTILAVCSCTVLPLFAGIYKMGAGIGPATAFLYSGPAINILAIVLSAKVLGWQIGLARAAGSVGFAYVIGLVMAFIFREDETEKKKVQMAMPAEEPPLPLWQEIVYMASMIGVLVFANWAKPDVTEGFWYGVYTIKWYITGAFGLLFTYTFVKWLKARFWVSLVGVIAVGLLAALFPEVSTSLILCWHSLSRLRRQNLFCRNERLDRCYLVIYPHDPAATLRRCAYCRVSARHARHGQRDNPKPVDCLAGRRQFIICQSSCIRCWGIHVFRDPHRGAYSTGPSWLRYGERPGTRFAPCRSRTVIAEYDCHKEHPRDEEILCLLRSRYRILHNCGDDFWMDSRVGCVE